LANYRADAAYNLQGDGLAGAAAAEDECMSVKAIQGALRAENVANLKRQDC